MSLLETLEETKKQLAALEGNNEQDNGNNDAAESGAEEGKDETEKVGGDSESTSDAETKKEEVKEEPKVESKKEEQLDDAGYARLRREKAAAEKRAKEAEEKLQKSNATEEHENPINKALLEVIQENEMKKMERAYSVLEDRFKQSNPDYESVSNSYKEALYQAERIKNPRKSHYELLELTKNTLLQKAEGYAKAGFDPIEELYSEALDLGIKPKSKQIEEAVEVKEEPKKPSLEAIARNKARNAGMAAAQGTKVGGGQITAEALAGMSTAEFMKIPKAERDRALKALF